MQETCAEAQRLREMAKADEARGLALDLTKETYKSFPFAVLELVELRVLILNLSNLSVIPASINRLTNLEVLDLRSNDFKEFPSSICELTNLDVLDLSDNEIVSIPSDIERLKSLKTLKLQNTKLQGSLSEHISALTSLVHLDVSKNDLDAFPQSLANLKSLERLNIWSNSFVEVPSVLPTFTKLKNLNISYNKLETFSLDMLSLKQMEDLDLEGNKLTSFPEMVCSLLKLQRLDIGRNKISDIPENIQNLKNLRELWINHNSFTSFPRVICKLESLETLSISYNNIKSVPNDVAYMSYLKILELDFCGLDKMPLSLCMMKGLKWLSLGDNNITTIPVVLTSLHELSYINLEGNKNLKVPPRAILKRGIKAIFNYLNEAETKKTIYQKVIFLGNVRAGKSSLSRTLIQGSSQLSDDIDRTVVLDEMSWTPEENLSLQVYDFGGSAWYDVVQHFFIDEHSIVFLVVSLTDYSRDKYIDNVEKWLQIVQARAPGAHLFVVATHADLLPEDDVHDKQESILDMMQTRDKVQIEHVEEEIKRLEGLGSEAETASDSLKKSLKNRLVLPKKVYSVSSKTLINLAELKEDLLEKAKELGRVIPLSWQQLYHGLHTSELSKAKNFLTYKDVVQLDHETMYGRQATPLLYSPVIPKRKVFETQRSVVHEQAESYSSVLYRKRSAHKRPNHEALRNSPAENDEQKPRSPRFQVRKLDEESEYRTDNFALTQEDRLHDILAFFHSIGDVLWYEGKPEIKNFVFHKQSFLIELLKRIFSERPDERAIERPESIKLGLSLRTIKADREDLRTKGIMSLKFLEALLDDFRMEKKMIEALMQLLMHFDLCFKLEDEDQTNRISKLHFPWFLSESIPQEAALMLRHPPDDGRWRFILEYDFPLRCPPALYDSMAVHTHRVVLDSCSIRNWKNGLYARIHDSQIVLQRTFDEVQMSTISFHVEGAGKNELWSILTNLHKEFRILMVNWPGIMLEMWLVCPHCTAEGIKEPHRFRGENIERCYPENEDRFTCPKAPKLGTIPADLIFPGQASRDVPSDDELSKIAYMVGSDWRLLGRALGLNEYDLDHVNANNDNLHEKAYQMLQKWKKARGSKAHCAGLIMALETEELKRNDVVEKIVSSWMR